MPPPLSLQNYTGAQRRVPYVLTGPEFRSYGRGQLDRVLTDRPMLQTVVEPGSGIEQWLLKAFESPGLSYKLAWTNDPTTPDVPTGGQSDPYPDADGVSYIRVDGVYKEGPLAGESRGADEVLSNLVYELNNARRGPEKAALDRAAAFETMGRKDYIAACAKSEYEAFHDTALVYDTIWEPYCEAHLMPTLSDRWYDRETEPFDQYLAQYPRTNWYPWRFYGDRYDWYRWQCGKGSLAKAQRGDAAAEEVVGWIYFQTGDFTDALPDFLKAALQGNIDAEMSLAWLYDNGKGTTLDERKAFFWYLKAAQGGNKTAMAEVAWRYKLGFGVTADPVEARRWYLRTTPTS